MTTDQRCIISSLRLDSSTDTYYFPESLAVQLSGFISTGSSSQTEALFSCLKEEKPGETHPFLYTASLACFRYKNGSFQKTPVC